jgi:hypothetical protein
VRTSGGMCLCGMEQKASTRTLQEGDRASTVPSANLVMSWVDRGVGRLGSWVRSSVWVVVVVIILAVG